MPQFAELTSDEDFTRAAPPVPTSLEQLAMLVKRDLDLTRYPAKSWVLPRSAPDGNPALDVLIIGGGLGGLAAAFGLLQQRVANILVIDENAEGNEGPWSTYARMPTLRTQKDEIDFANLAGRIVAVLGGAASAFDNGIVAAEQRARGSSFSPGNRGARRNAMAWGEFNGYLAHFPDLAPADRWRFTQQMKRFKPGPPIATVERAASLPNMFIHRGTNWSVVRMEADAIRIDATDGVLMADFAILGTGYVTDIAVVDELAGLLPLILLWRDVFTPPPGEEDPELSGSCYLGANFELQEKMPGTAPWLNAVFNFARGAQLSMGAMSIGFSGIKFGIPRLVQGITRRLFIEDVPEYFEGMKVWQGSAAVYEP